MTYIDYNGKQINKGKESFLMDLSIQRIIEEEFCRQINSGIKILPKDAKAILEFAKRAGDKLSK